MTDYSKCKMYIILDDNWDCYIGHTVQPLQIRLNCHNTKTNKNSSKQLMGNNPIIELLEDYPCNNIREAEHREQYWMDQFPNRVNTKNAIYDKNAIAKSWREDNPQSVKDASAKYNKNNRELINEKRREVIKGRGPYTCECGAVIRSNTNSGIKSHEQSKKHINYNLSQLHKDEPNIS